MKKMLFLMLFLLISGAAIVNAQVKIGDNTAPRTGAVLDLKTSYVGGLLLPNVNIVDTGKIDFTEATLWNVDSNHELTGLIVYNTNETTGKGVYVWDGETWLSVGIGGGGGGGTVDPGCGKLTIDSQSPASTTINANAGDVVTLSVTATITDGNIPTFQWYQNTQAGTAGAQPIQGQTTGNMSSLTVPTAAGTNLFYYCKVTYACDNQEEVSRNWNVVVAATGPGNTFLGTTSCWLSSKSSCICAVGTAVFYLEASPAQREAARLTFTDSGGIITWWANRDNGNLDIYSYRTDIGRWAVSGAFAESERSTACFQ